MERQEKNLKKITAEAKRLRTILSAAVIGSMYDLTGYVDAEIECDRIYGVLKDIRFGKEDEKKFLPGRVELQFALSAGVREISINLVHIDKNSNYDKLTNIVVMGHPQNFLPDFWDREIARHNNRVIERKIVTGNILGAYSHPAIATLHPRFITFTLAPDEKGEKRIMHGLLMPIDEKRMKDLLGSVALPMDIGIKYANSTSTIYPITGFDARFSLMPVRCTADGALYFRISVDDKSSKAFEGSAYDAIRGYFNAEPIISTLPEKASTTKNLKAHKSRMRYFTNNLPYDSETLEEILTFLARQKATIVVPREQITRGEMQQMESHSLHEDDKSWLTLDWKNETEQPLPPSQSEALLRITPPMLGGGGNGREVQCYSEFVTLCRETMKIQGENMADTYTRMTVKRLYFEWKQCMAENDNRRFLRRNVINELHELLVAPNQEIKLKSYYMLCQSATSEHLDAVANIRERFKSEFLFMAPPKEQVKQFLDSCPCTARLDHVVRALQRYLDGGTDIIVD